MSANTGREQAQQTASLFDDLIGGGEQFVRDGQPEHPGGLVVDDQLELRRLHDRQFRRLGAHEKAACIDTGLAIRLRNFGAIAHQQAGFRQLAVGRTRRYPVARRQISHLDTPGEEKRVATDEKRVGPFARKRRESRVDLAGMTGKSVGLAPLRMRPV